ncbi:hypothetical protein KC323_g7 [Hortaea werneckii]|nr:hypothetical protein KC323_g7 [Hortaea werneckii]
MAHGLSSGPVVLKVISHRVAVSDESRLQKASSLGRGILRRLLFRAVVGAEAGARGGIVVRLDHPLCSYLPAQVTNQNIT